MTFARSPQNQRRFVPARSKTTRLYRKAAVAKGIDFTKATADSSSPAAADAPTLVGRPARSPRLSPTTESSEVFVTDPNVTIKNLAEGRSDTFRVDPENLTLVIDPAHPLYDERVAIPVDEGLITSIREHGIRENVSVRRNGSLFEVLDGRQRVKAALELNKRIKKELGRAFDPKVDRILVPVTMSKDNDNQAAKVMVTLNEIRTQDSPMVQAAKAKRLLDRGIPKQEVCNQFGKPTSWLSQIMKVLDTDDTVQSAVDKGMIPVTAASKLAALPRDQQKKAMAELRDSGRGLTRTNVKAKVKAMRTAESTGQAEAPIVTPPKRSVIVAVHDAYAGYAGNFVVSEGALFARNLLKWVLTGTGAADIPGPTPFAHGTAATHTLADWLREYETLAKSAPKAATA